MVIYHLFRKQIVEWWKIDQKEDTRSLEIINQCSMYIDGKIIQTAICLDVIYYDGCFQPTGQLHLFV